MDEGQVRIVMENLIRNAYEAMPDGGRLTITAAVPHPLSASPVDSRHGIDQDKLQRVREPFYSTKSRGGLGLARAEALIDKIKWRHRVEREPGTECAFTIRLNDAS
jgi:signal transduction histidine kinase